MKYYIESENKIVTAIELREIGIGLSTNGFIQRGIYPVREHVPEYNEESEMLVPKELVKNEKLYEQYYEVKPIDDAERLRRAEVEKQELYNELCDNIRQIRNQKLLDTDFLLMQDYPLADDKKQQVLEYRQALRDIPLQENFPYNIIWPVLNI